MDVPLHIAVGGFIDYTNFNNLPTSTFMEELILHLPPSVEYVDLASCLSHSCSHEITGAVALLPERCPRLKFLFIGVMERTSARLLNAVSKTLEV